MLPEMPSKYSSELEGDTFGLQEQEQICRISSRYIWGISGRSIRTREHREGRDADEYFKPEEMQLVYTLVSHVLVLTK
jgi:hypothetical protein